jgi:hypothetical protein
MRPQSRQRVLATMLTALCLGALASRAEAQGAASRPHEIGDNGRSIVTVLPPPETSDIGRLPPPAAQNPTKRDSVLNGVLIGAAVGGLLGLIPDHYDDCEECHDSLYASIAVGAGVGLLVDLLRDGRKGVSPSRSDSGVRFDVAIAPNSVGVGGRVRWR